MPLKYAVCLSALFDEEHPDFAKSCSAAKKAGFKAVELSFQYKTPLEKLVEIKEKEGLEHILINSYPGDPEAGEFGLAALPGSEQDFRDSLELSVKYCKALKCKRMHVIAGMVPNCSEADRPEMLRRMEETFVSNLKYAAERLSKEGILAVIEPINPIVSVPGYFLHRQDQGVAIIKKVGHENLKLLMDLFHVQIMQGNICNTIKQFFPYIGHVQMAQVPHRNEPSAPGEVNYDFIVSYLENLGYDGWVGVEYSPVHGEPESMLKWLERHQ